jgi:hypothetical protein
MVVGLAVPTLGASSLLIGIYPARTVRVAMKTRRRGFSWFDSFVWAASCTVAPIPEAVGVAKYHFDRLRQKAPELIEYK